jgi:hypothetical protein
MGLSMPKTAVPELRAMSPLLHRGHSQRDREPA